MKSAPSQNFVSYFPDSQFGWQESIATRIRPLDLILAAHDWLKLMFYIAMICNVHMKSFSSVFSSFKFESYTRWKLLLSAIEWYTGTWQNILPFILSLDHNVDSYIYYEDTCVKPSLLLYYESGGPPSIISHSIALSKLYKMMLLNRA
jgi:hypothetical protein